MQIDGKEYEINLKDEEFAKIMEEELAQKFSTHAKNSVKKLIRVYIAKCYECYLLEKRIQELLKKIS